MAKSEHRNESSPPYAPRLPLVLLMRKTVSLKGGDWRFGSVAQKPFGPSCDLDQVNEWLPATVPGDVRLDLLRCGKIPDPFYGLDNEASLWVDARDWWYVRELVLEGPTTARYRVSFEGIDYQSAVYWNREELGRHVGMFSRQVYELPGNGEGELAVRIWGSDALPRLDLNLVNRMIRRLTRRYLPANPAFPDRLATLKCQMSFGWDFAPRIRTCGIWEDASLIQTGAVFIGDVWVQSVPDGRVLLRLSVDAEQDQALRARMNVRGVNFASDAQEFEFNLDAGKGVSSHEFRFQLQEPRTWDPWDRGKPNLYRLELTLYSGEGETDSVVATFGLRTIDLAPNPGAPPDEPSWTCLVNGIPEFIRGANWVPADSIPARVKREDYAELIGLARSANVNLLRVWGGGLREKRAFYDLCDEQGILVWQEFPFSGAPFDELARDAEFLSFAHDECGAMVRALRNHPSLALWCGGNEFGITANKRLVYMMLRTVAENDGTRPFKPASPSRGEHHNWRVWHWSANSREYRKDDAGFYSEFGLQSPPDPEALTHFMPDGKVWPPGEEWEYHNAELAKLRRYARAIAPDVNSLEAFVKSSQEAQLRGLQVMIEYARRRKGRVAGCAFWQFNEPWPAISWSVLDYSRRPKPAYFKIKQIYSPVLVSFQYPLVARSVDDVVSGELWLINDTVHAVRGELRATLDSIPLLSRAVDAPPDTVARVGELQVRLSSGANELKLELYERDMVISTNEYRLNYCDRGEISWYSARLNDLGERFKR
jgi:beta-mannosidase